MISYRYPTCDHDFVNIRSNPNNIISGLVEIINDKYKLSRAGVYCFVQYQRTFVLLIVVDVIMY